MEKIQLANFPEPHGHYSPAVVHNGLVFVSGQLPVDPETGMEVTDSIEDQTEQCLRNVSQVLQAAGSELDHVLKMTVFISDEKYWGAVNETCARVLGKHKPARAIIPVGDFRGDFLIEIEAIAALKN